MSARLNLYKKLKYNKLPGTNEHGRAYEHEITLMLILKLLNSPCVKHFWIARDMLEADGFDDVVVRVEYADDKNTDCCEPINLVLFVQLKHKETKPVTIEGLTSPTGKGDFNLKKYFEAYEKIKKSYNNYVYPIKGCHWEDCKFIIFTNAHCPLKSNETINSAFIEGILKTGEKSKIFAFIEEDRNNILQKMDNQFTDCKKDDKQREYYISNLEDFLVNRLLIFTNQDSANTLKKTISKIINDYMAGESLVDNAVDFVCTRFSKGLWLTDNLLSITDDYKWLQEENVWDILSSFIQGVSDQSVRYLIWVHLLCKKNPFSIGKPLPSSVTNYVEREITGTKESVMYLAELGVFCVVIDLNDRDYVYRYLNKMQHKNVHYDVIPSTKILKSLRENVNRKEAVAEFIIEIKSNRQLKDSTVCIMEQIDNNTYVLLNEIKNMTVSFLLTADSGMGKSVYFTRKAELIRAQDPSQWVISINLSEYSDYFYNINSNDDPKVITKDFLLHIATDGQDEKYDIQRALFEYYLTLKNKVVIFLDAVDEISPDYFDKLATIIKIIRNEYSDSIYLFVSTRPVMQHDVENVLEIKSMGLREFTEDNAKECIARAWAQTIADNELILMELAHCIINAHRYLAHTPMFCALLSKICRDYALQNVKSPQIPLQIKNTNIQSEFELYAKFVDFIYEEHAKEKKKSDLSIIAVMRDYKILRQMSLLKHKKAALLEVLSSDEINIINDNTSNNDLFNGVLEEIEMTGLISLVTNKKPIFIHRTVAEYLAALWLQENYNINNENYYIIDNMVTSRNKLFYYFVWKDTENLLMHRAALLGSIESVLENVDDINRLDKIGRTPLHYLAIMKFDDKQKNNWLLNYVPNYVKDKTNKYPHDYRGNMKQYVLLLWLIRTKGEFKNLTKWIWLCFSEQKGIVFTLCSILSRDCPLHLAVINNKFDVFKKQLESGYNINSVDSGGRTVLHLVVIHDKNRGRNNLFIKEIINHSPEYTKDTIFGMYPHEYCSAIHGCNSDMFKLLMQTFRVNEPNSNVRAVNCEALYRQVDQAISDENYNERKAIEDDNNAHLKPPYLNTTSAGYIPLHIAWPSNVISSLDTYYNFLLQDDVNHNGDTTNMYPHDYDNRYCVRDILLGYMLGCQLLEFAKTEKHIDMFIHGCNLLELIYDYIPLDCTRGLDLALSKGSIKIRSTPARMIRTAIVGMYLREYVRSYTPDDQICKGFTNANLNARDSELRLCILKNDVSACKSIMENDNPYHNCCTNAEGCTALHDCCWKRFARMLLKGYEYGRSLHKLKNQDRMKLVNIFKVSSSYYARGIIIALLSRWSLNDEYVRMLLRKQTRRRLFPFSRLFKLQKTDSFILADDGRKLDRQTIKKFWPELLETRDKLRKKITIISNTDSNTSNSNETIFCFGGLVPVTQNTEPQSDPAFSN